MKTRLMGRMGGMALAVVLLLTGCATTGTNDTALLTTVAKTGTNDTALLTTVAKTASYVGTRVWLDSHPQDQAIFMEVERGLRVLIAAGEFDAAELTAVLKQLPVTELRGDTGAVIVDTAVVLWDSYGRKLADLDKQQAFTTYVLPVAKAVHEGMQMGLGLKRET